ncbi:LytR family transcriptional attenuator [Haloactinopolyspora alba]|uniref:LytR family transcriptional attenuator n=1 Tax=Haloactinopolyspora alba TaxID=648780 RepID=A0A2P8DM57_9ACTN|nr:LCP family protein [Haloactinopolyspora alba]PSK98277.1 LytR family transcriptional attenuator [Haloactinopolyspora alba]
MSGEDTSGHYSGFLGRAGLGALIPGIGLVAAGRRWTGWIVFAAFVLTGAAAAVYSVRAGGTGLLRLGTDPERIEMVGVGLLGVAAAWLLCAVVSLYLLQPPGLNVVQRLGGALVVVVAASLVVAPLGIGSRYAFKQRDTIESVFADEEKQHSLTIPKDATEQDPWAGQPRVNVLILGADSGENRDGTRTDTVMVASIDTDTGETALFSLPRNLQYVPLPEGPLRDAYPDGYHGEPESAYWLFAMYRNLPAEFPDYFEGVKDPGAEALKLAVGEALGLKISYYVMVNLEGFQTIVDALGGIRLDVPYRIPIGTKKSQWGGCTEPSGWIEKGQNQHLDGYHALWFARARCGPPPISDDYERMRRQRCVIGAIAQQVNPFNVLQRYQQLASAAEQTMSTDIGRQRLDDFAELALKVQDAGIRSLPFTDEIVDYNDPDYELIRKFVRESLKPPESEPDPSATDPATTAPPEGGTDDGERGEPDGPATGDSGDPGDEAGTGDPGTGSEPGGEETPSEDEGAQEISAVC